MSIERDRCAITALQIALRRLGAPEWIDDGSGNRRLTAKGQDIEYVRMTLDLYDGTVDELGERMVTVPQNVATLSLVKS